MKIVHFADSHVDYLQYRMVQRRADFFNAFDTAIHGALSLQPDVITIGGDLFHSPKLGPTTLRDVEAVLADAKAAGVPVVAVSGNHDKPFRATESWVDYLTFDGLLHVVDNDYISIGNALIFGLPYSGHRMMRDMQTTYENVYPLVNTDTALVLLAHVGIQGSFSWVRDGISEDFITQHLPAVDVALVGHFHIPNRAGRIFQPGSTERTAADIVEGGLWEIDLNGREIAAATFHPISEFKAGVPRPFINLSMSQQDIPANVIAKAGPYDAAMVRIRTAHQLTAKDVYRLVSPAIPLRVSVDQVSDLAALTPGTLAASDRSRRELEQEVIAGLAGDLLVKQDVQYLLQADPSLVVDHFIGGIDVD